MNIARLVLIGFVLQTPSSALAKQSGCEGNPALVGSCYALAGSYNLSADASMVLWPDDDRRRPIKIRAAPESERDIPVNLSRAMDQAMADHGITARVHGDFLVCPISPTHSRHAGEPFGCIETATDLVAAAATSPSSRHPSNSSRQ